MSKRLLLLAGLLILVCASAFAQTTGSLTGSVTTGGAPLPGATVTISSPALQGVRTTVTGANGDYNFPALPPGRYTVTLELEGLQKVTRTAEVRLAETARVEADLKVSSVSEAITVTASAPSVLETPQVSTNLTRETIEALPIGRSIAQRIQLAPGVNNAGPNNQTIINGAPSYDNLYMVNGVVVNDSIRGQPENLFIEDAIQETTLLTAGVSAEYGRFTGGVVNTITKSGGNEFTGTLRDNLTSPSWSRVTDFHDPVSGKAQPKNASLRSNQYEGTLGGFLVKDHLWFFGAGRKFNESISNVTTATNLPYVNQRNNKRYEGKLTGNITQKHTIVGSYLHNNTDETNNRFGNVVDLRSLSTRQLPNWLEAFHYTGAITNNLVLEGQYSRRYFAFIGGGGPLDLINGTLLRDNNTARRMWAPTFCGECDPKTRNNKDYQAKANYFLSTKNLGSHNVVGGYDEFHELRHENNYQSGSNFRLWGDFVYDGPNVYFHADPLNGYVTNNPILQLSRTSDIATKSFFVNDKWDFTNRLSFNLGARYDKNDAIDQSHNKIAKNSGVSPRLGVIFDVRGNGRDRVSANYARYLSKIDSGIADTVSTGGNPGSTYFNYRGPEINAFDPKTGKIIGTPVPTEEVIKQIFAWFNSVGGVSGYKNVDSIFVPGLTERLDSIKPPRLDEVSVGYGHQIGTSAFVRADIIHRTWAQFYTIFRDTTTGQNVTPTGDKVDVGLVTNSDRNLSRRYNGAQLQGAWKLGRSNLGANYTYAKLRGNVEGETFNNATVFVGNNEYPEYRQFSRNQPVGFLNEDIRHRANIFANYDFPFVIGSLNLGVVERFHTGSPYSAAASIDLRDGTKTGPAKGTGVVNPGYATAPSSSTYFFRDRGAFRTQSVSATDVTGILNFHPYGRATLFVRGDLLNAFNQQRVEFASSGLGAIVENRVYTRRQKTKSTDGLVSFVAFNPYTTTPVEYQPGVSDPKAGPYNYQFDPNFGKATNKEAYQLPRTYRFAVGVRF